MRPRRYARVVNGIRNAIPPDTTSISKAFKFRGFLRKILNTSPDLVAVSSDLVDYSQRRSPFEYNVAHFRPANPKCAAEESTLACRPYWKWRGEASSRGHQRLAPSAFSSLRGTRRVRRHPELIQGRRGAENRVCFSSPQYVSSDLQEVEVRSVMTSLPAPLCILPRVF